MSVRVKETEVHLEHFVSQLAAYGQVTIGKRFWETRALDLTEIAKLVRKSISADVKTDALPKGKYSVKVRRYAGGESLYLVADFARKPKLDLAEVRSRLQRKLDEFNYDAGDAQYDYHCARFIGLVTLLIQGRPR